MNVRHQLVVRVKRRRDQEPVNSLCIVEDDEQSLVPNKRHAGSRDVISNVFSQLSTNDNRSAEHADVSISAAGTLSSPQISQAESINISAKNDGKVASVTRSHLVLTRVNTLHDTVLDYSTVTKDDSVSEISKPAAKEDHETYNISADSSLWIPRGKRLLRSDESKETVLVIDIHQEQRHGAIPSTSSGQPRKSPQSADIYIEDTIMDESKNIGQTTNTRIKVYDPATRLMDEAITRAWRVGDFNGISNALIRGADVNYQQDSKKTQGLTALMSAAKHGNIRMVNRLLEKGADILVKDASGKTVFDLLREITYPESKRSAYIDINIALNKALAKNHLSQSRVMSTEISESEYVYDIFKFDINSSKRSRSMMEDESIPSGHDKDIGSSEISKENTTASSAFHSMPYVPVGGIHIGSDGNVDLVFAYDSDWSDLGDDEDPDSNDERYVGNDYPDEDEGDDNSINADDTRMQSKHFDNSDYGDSDSDCDIDHHRTHMPDTKGYVQRYHVRNEVENEISSVVKRDTKTLQQLWEEGGSDDDIDLGIDENPIKLKQQRLRGMQSSSGLQFASNPREFDRSGLPKYGHDLSDDDDYVEKDESVIDLLNARKLFESRMQGHEGQFDSYISRSKLPRNTVAYDSELDESDSSMTEERYH